MWKIDRLRKGSVSKPYYSIFCPEAFTGDKYPGFFPSSFSQALVILNYLIVLQMLFLMGYFYMKDM